MIFALVLTASPDDKESCQTLFQLCLPNEQNDATGDFFFLLCVIILSLQMSPEYNIFNYSNI